MEKLKTRTTKAILYDKRNSRDISILNYYLYYREILINTLIIGIETDILINESKLKTQLNLHIIYS